LIISADYPARNPALYRLSIHGSNIDMVKKIKYNTPQPETQHFNRESIYN